MRHKDWVFGTLLLILAPFLASALAPSLASASEPTQTQWKLSEITWVKRLSAEPGAPANAQPAKLTAETLQAALGPVMVAVDNQDQPLFTTEELKPLSKALSEAIALAQPGEDLILLSTFKRESGFMERATGLTARLFVRDGALHLIVHDARLPFMDRYLADRTLPAFTFGSRTTPGTASLRAKAPGAMALRSDWLALPLPTPLPTASAPLMLPPVKPASAAAPDVPTGPRDAAFYEAQAQRLKALKKMREENLLTEAEYQQKRDAILKTL